MNNLSLFTGSGIGDYAAAQCGIRTVAMCENDPWCCYALERMFPEAKLFKDVHDVSATALRQFGPIDIISGGFPCQNLSTAGRGEGIEGSRSGLWREMFRIIRQVRPAWLVIENVPAIKVRGVDRVLAPLERIGYTCWPLVVGAEHVGATHRRHRVWIVGRCLADAPSGRHGADGAALGDAGHADQCGESLADAESDGYQGTEPTNGPSSNLRRRLAEPCCWPSRPGEPQHAWEAPRLVERPVGGEFAGMAGRVHSRANKALLRVCGNGWVYQNALLIYQWIAEVETRPSGS